MKRAKNEFWLLTILVLAIGTVGVAPFDEDGGAVRQTVSPTATPTSACGPGEYNRNGICEPRKRLTPVEAPVCRWVSPAGGTLPPDGVVTCHLNWGSGIAILERIAVGCLDIERIPFPRGWADGRNTFEVKGVVPLTPDFRGGYYLDPLRRYAVRNYSETPYAIPNPPVQYPSIRNARFGLRFVLDTATFDFDIASWDWGDDDVIFGSVDGLDDSRAGVIYRHSSASVAGAERPAVGPDYNLRNILPSYKVRLRTVWRLEMVREYDVYGVTESNDYVMLQPEAKAVPWPGLYVSYRVWDVGQSSAGVEDIYCNARDGFIPVPIIETQAVLTR